jgi:hypothetical protein
MQTQVPKTKPLSDLRRDWKDADERLRYIVEIIDNHRQTGRELKAPYLAGNEEAVQRVSAIEKTIQREADRHREIAEELGAIEDTIRHHYDDIERTGIRVDWAETITIRAGQPPNIRGWDEGEFFQSVIIQADLVEPELQIIQAVLKRLLGLVAVGVVEDSADQYRLYITRQEGGAAISADLVMEGLIPILGDRPRTQNITQLAIFAKRSPIALAG